MMNVQGYESLAQVLQRAYDQAASGKGKERHAGDRPFDEQPMQSISELLGTHNGMLYQAMKKIQESNRLKTGPAVRELLGTINYIAGAVIYLESQPSDGTYVATSDPCLMDERSAAARAMLDRVAVNGVQDLAMRVGWPCFKCSLADGHNCASTIPCKHANGFAGFKERPYQD